MLSLFKSKTNTVEELRGRIEELEARKGEIKREVKEAKQAMIAATVNGEGSDAITDTMIRLQAESESIDPAIAALKGQIFSIRIAELESDYAVRMAEIEELLRGPERAIEDVAQRLEVINIEGLVEFSGADRATRLRETVRNLRNSAESDALGSVRMKLTSIMQQARAELDSIAVEEVAELVRQATARLAAAHRLK